MSKSTGKSASGKKEEYPYPSRFGSHQKMVDQAETDALNNQEWVVLRDEFGLYVTSPKNLDTGLADPYRFSWARSERFKEVTGQTIITITVPENL